MNLHRHYDQLNNTERDFVDDVFREVYAMVKHIPIPPPLRGDDSVERAVDGVARWIIESRG